ncbi:nitroreductase family protein [Gaoshiqia sp. Z1-71]|uniref:nitroreductase family protein n=1 Tax=Gaoshiqia hydrogeniformans TaxID=3290090 RepID=UPI003BF90356
MRKIRGLLALFVNEIIDFVVYTMHSGLVFRYREKTMGALITYNYHSIEKGLSMPVTKYGFGQEKIKVLIRMIKYYVKNNYNIHYSQFVAACSVLAKYYLFHANAKYDISEFFKDADYQEIKRYSDSTVGGSMVIDGKSYFEGVRFDYINFSKSRHSIRNFSSIPVDVGKVENAVNLAKYCPSACNRQSSKVYLVQNKIAISEILKIQKGINATAELIYQLLVVTSSRSYFFTSGERNQHFIDGGIFLHSLLLALHYERIASCPLHWSLNFREDNKIKRIIGLSNGEKVIALVAIGNVEDTFKVPASHRKNIGELFSVVE